MFGILNELENNHIDLSTQLMIFQCNYILFFNWQAIVTISSVSPEALFVCTQSGLIAQLISELDKEDILLQVKVF